MKNALFLFALLTAAAAGAQPSIRGRVTDGVSPLEGAAVVVRALADSALLDGTYTDAAGRFSLAGDALDHAARYLQLSYLGYADRRIELDATGIDVDLGDLTLQESGLTVAEVSVSAKRPLLTQLPDRTVLTIENSTYANGQNAQTLLRILPEVQADAIGNISFRGQSGVIVYVDGRKTYLEGQQLQAFLRGIPSHTIKHFEVIPNPPSNFDAAGTAAVINIVTRRDSRVGWSLGLNGYGESNTRYPGYGAGTQLGYGTQRLHVGLNYDYFYFNFYNGIHQEQILRERTPQLRLVQDDFYREIIRANVVNGSVDYDLRPGARLGLKYSLQHIGWQQPFRSTATAGADPAQPDSSFTTRTSNDETLNQGVVGAFYEWKSRDEKRRLNIQGDYVTFEDISSAFFLSTFAGADGRPLRANDSAFIHNPVRSEIIAATVDYTVAPNDRFDFAFGAKLSEVRTDNAIRYLANQEPGSIPDPRLSNTFEYREVIPAAYGEMTANWEQLTLKGGLRAEYSLVEGRSDAAGANFDRQYLDFFPTLYVAYRLPEERQLNLSAGRRIGRPVYTSLNPFVEYQTPYSIRTGNPALDPAYTNTAELAYRHRGLFTLTVGHKYVTGIINPVYRQTADGPLVLTYDNLSNENYSFVSLNFPIQPTEWWQINTYLTGYRRSLDWEGVDLQRSTFTVYQSQSFTLSPTTRMDLSLNYQSRTIYDFSVARGQGGVNLSLSQSIWQERGSIGLSYSDLFHTVRPRIETDLPGIYIYSVGDLATRYLRLSFSYAVSRGKSFELPDTEAASSAQERERLSE